MRGKLLSMSFGAVALFGLTFCVGDDPVGLSATPTDEAGTAAETGSDTDAATDSADGVDSADAADATPPLKQVFVTDAAYYGDMTIVGGGPATGGVAGADKRCMEAAATKFPGRTFHALIAGTGVNAYTHVGNGPWHVGEDLVGTVANLKFPMDPLTPIIVTETGKSLTTSSSAFVGAMQDSTGDVDPDYNCMDWSTVADIGVDVGTVGGTGGTWYYAGPDGCNHQHHLYCFEQ